MIAVTQEADAPPLVRIFAAKFETALQGAEYAALIPKAVGTFALKAKAGTDALTVEVSRQVIALSSGVKPDADIVIHLDFNKPSAKPKIEGLLKHPFYALAVAKILEFPNINWADALRKLWDQYKDYPGMPEGVTAKSLDEDRQLSVGNTTQPLYVEGNSADLSEAFSGGSPFIQLLSEGKLKGHYEFQHAVVLSDVTLKIMLGSKP